MSEYDETLKSIEEIAEQLKHLQDYAFQQYSKAVDSVIKGHITSKEDIDRLLDYMMDFYEDERFQTLVGKFCSYLLQNRRDVVGPFENFYKLQAEAFSNKEADKP